MSSRVFMISDLHLGHKRILDFAGDFRGGTTLEEHDEWIIEQWNSVVRKRDLVIVLGDVAFTREGLSKIGRLKGTKHLIMANHDRFAVEDYNEYFRIKPGIYKYKGFWLSHCPIHPEELRGCKNIHGHVHQHHIPSPMTRIDPRYINVCVEACNGVPFLFSDLKEQYG